MPKQSATDVLLSAHEQFQATLHKGQLIFIEGEGDAEHRLSSILTLEDHRRASSRKYHALLRTYFRPKGEDNVSFGMD